MQASVYPPYLELLTVFHFLCNDLVECIQSINAQNINCRTDKINDGNFGILHTLQDYALWAAKEEHIAKMLTERLELLEVEKRLIKRYLDNHKMMKSLEKLTDTPKKEENELSSRAILIHREIYRIATIISQLRDLPRSSNFLRNQKSDCCFLLEDVRSTLDLESLKGRANSRSWVGWEDLYMSMTTFIHNEEVYGFEPRDMVKGIQLETTFGGNLYASHCVEIGILALFRHVYNCAVEWLELSLSQSLEENNKVDKNDQLISHVASALLSVAIQQHNRDLLTFRNSKEENKMGYYDKYFSFYLDPIIEEEAPEDRIRFRQKLYWDYRGLGQNTNAEAQFMDLCGGNIAQTSAMQIPLRCHYEHERHPYLYINPVKVEHLSISPPIFQFYDMVGNKTIEKIKTTYRPKVKLSKVIGLADLNAVTSMRTSAGIGMDRYSLPRGVYKLAEYVSGIKIWGSSEPTQFAEYTYGRYYTFHKDLIEVKEDSKTSKVNSDTDRLATLLYYLELPEMGGYTPFCQAGIYANPIRGSAVLWYNLHRNGSARGDVEHGACPVIHGHKIIMNHWITYHRNWNNFKCTQNSFE